MGNEITNSATAPNLPFEAHCTSFRPKPIRYGLSCAKCHTYYSADLSVCPICNCRERVSARVAPSNTRAAF